MYRKLIFQLIGESSAFWQLYPETPLLYQIQETLWKSVMAWTLPHLAIRSDAPFYICREITFFKFLIID